MFPFVLGYLLFSRNERGTLLDTLTSFVVKLTPELFHQSGCIVSFVELKNHDMKYECEWHKEPYKLRNRRFLR